MAWDGAEGRSVIAEGEGDEIVGLIRFVEFCLHFGDLFFAEVVDEHEGDEHHHRAHQDQPYAHLDHGIGDAGGLVADGIRLRIVAHRLHTEKGQGEGDALGDLSEQAVHGIDGAFLSHTCFQLLIVDAVVDHSPGDEVEHPAACLNEHQPDHINDHTRGVAGDGDAQHDDGRDDAEKEGHADRDLLAEPCHDLGSEGQEQHHGRVGDDGAEGDHVRVAEVDLEQPF